MKSLERSDEQSQFSAIINSNLLRLENSDLIKQTLAQIVSMKKTELRDDIDKILRKPEQVPVDLYYYYALTYFSLTDFVASEKDKILLDAICEIDCLKSNPAMASLVFALRFKYRLLVDYSNSDLNQFLIEPLKSICPYFTRSDHKKLIIEVLRKMPMNDEKRRKLERFFSANLKPRLKAAQRIEGNESLNCGTLDLLEIIQSVSKETQTALNPE